MMMMMTIISTYVRPSCVGVGGPHLDDAISACCEGGQGRAGSAALHHLPAEGRDLVRQVIELLEAKPGHVAHDRRVDGAHVLVHRLRGG
jgi:hypothetical protein